MTEIDYAVKNRITDKVTRHDTRLKRTKGMKHGLEIYEIIQKPTNTAIRNIVYLTSRIKKVKKHVSRTVTQSDKATRFTLTGTPNMGNHRSYYPGWKTQKAICLHTIHASKFRFHKELLMSSIKL